MVQSQVLYFLICKIHAVGLGQVYLLAYSWIFYVRREEATTKTNHYLHSLPQFIVRVYRKMFSFSGEQRRKMAVVSKKKRTLLFCSTKKNAEDLCLSLLPKGSASSFT